MNIVEFLPPDLNEITVQSPKTQYYVNDPFYYDIGGLLLLPIGQKKLHSTI